MNLLLIFYKSITDFFGNVYAVGVGIFTSVLGYFIPIRDIVQLMIGLFIADVLFGYAAARKGKKRNGKVQKRFSVQIIWEHTIPRMLISIVLVMTTYMWDLTYSQEFVNTYKAIGWFISGVLIFSIADNGFFITKWSVFMKVSQLIRGKIKGETEIDLKEEKEEEN